MSDHVGLRLTGLTVLLFRIVATVLFGLLASGISLYIHVRKLEVLSMITHGPRFLQGLEIGGTIVCTVSKTARIG